MRHYYTVQYFDEATHSWVCKDNSTGEEKKIVFSGQWEPYVGDCFSVSHLEPLISVAVGEKHEPHAHS